jgi:hypothetical protein
MINEKPIRMKTNNLYGRPVSSVKYSAQAHVKPIAVTIHARKIKPVKNKEPRSPKACCTYACRITAPLSAFAATSWLPKPSLNKLI